MWASGVPSDPGAELEIACPVAGGVDQSNPFAVLDGGIEEAGDVAFGGHDEDEDWRPSEGREESDDMDMDDCLSSAVGFDCAPHIELCNQENIT